MIAQVLGSREEAVGRETKGNRSYKTADKTDSDKVSSSSSDSDNSALSAHSNHSAFSPHDNELGQKDFKGDLKQSGTGHQAKCWFGFERLIPTDSEWVIAQFLKIKK